MAQGLADPVSGLRYEGHKAHAAPAQIACDVSLGSDALARSRMAHPCELLLGMKQPHEIHSRILIAKKLRRGDTQRVDGGEGRRHAGRWIRAYRPGKLCGAVYVNLKSDPRVGPPRDIGRTGCNLPVI